MDHARRKVVEAIRAQPKTSAKGKPSVAQVMLSKINALYRLERELAELDDEERHAARQARCGTAAYEPPVRGSRRSGQRLPPTR